LYYKKIAMKKSLYITVILIFSVSCFGYSAGPLNGNYTIDKTQPATAVNFQSFTAFADSLNMNGISAAVVATVAIASGPYNEQVEFANISGTSLVNTITIDGNGEQLTAFTTTTNRYVLRLKDISNFFIENLNVIRDTSSTGGFYGIHIFNTGNNITISNCTVNMNGTNSTLYGGFVASGSETSILQEGDFHFITIDSCSTTGGGYGASVFGLGSNLATEIRIENCNFLNFHSNGVYLRETNGAIVAGNNFNKNNTNVTSVNAIQVAQNANINTSIYNNIIRVDQLLNGTVTFRGIYLFNGTGHRVYNNVIHDVHLVSGNFTAIEIRSAGTAPEISFNTISLDHPGSSTGDIFGIKEELSNTNAVLRNNIISITQLTTGLKAGLVLGAIATVTTAYNSNYNDIYVPGGHTAIKNTLTPLAYTTLANWQSISGQDANSISADPVFVSPMQSIPTNPMVDNLGISLPGITTDILGVTRGVNPDIGAYEFTGVSLYEVDSSPIKAFPNPAKDIFYLTVPGNNNVQLSITDVAGRTVYEDNDYNSLVPVKISEWSAGVYYILIDGGKYRQPLVKR
jgi:trimeric autotransporter adhesin